jgi:fibrillarin-like rRNA methylase
VYAVEFSHRSGRDLINMAKVAILAFPFVDNNNNNRFLSLI